MMFCSNYRMQNTGSRLWRTESKLSVICYLSSVICLLTIGFIAGCAPKIARIDEGVQFPEKGEMKVESIEVGKAEDGDLVTIKASKPLSYTAFKLTAPLRLIIDIPDIDAGMYEGPIEVRDGIINRINTDLYKEKSGNIGRVEIEIEEGVGYELEPAGDVLFVRFERERKREGLEVIRVAADKTTLAPNILDGVQEKEERPELAEVEGGIGEAQAFPLKVVVVPEIAKEVPLSAGKKAERLLSVGVNQLDDNYIEAILRGDGYIRNYNTFGLDDPERVVIDLWDVESAISDDVLSMDVPNVEMVRIGSHPDKTRVVFDLRGVQKFSYKVEKRDDGLLVAFRGKEGEGIEYGKSDGTGVNLPPVVPLQVAQQVSTQVSKEGRVEIKGVDFEDSETSSKVIVVASDDVEYELAKSFDGKTVALILKGASLPANLQRTLDTSELNGPLALISSYGSGTGDDERVMVVMRLKEGSKYEVSRDNNKLTVEFPKAGVGMVAKVVENVPPVKVAETEIAKEGATSPVDEVVGAKLPLAPEKVVASKDQEVKMSLKPEEIVVAKESKPVEPKVAEPEVAVKLPPAPKKVVVNKKQAIKPAPEPLKVAKASKESGPVDKNKGKVKGVKKAAKRPKRIRKKKIREVMSPEIVATAEGYTGRRISLDFKDADIQNILRLIAEVSRLNIVAGNDVRGKVSLRLVNVPWDQVLEIVLKTNNLGMIRDGNVLRIAPLQKIAKEKAQNLADKKAEEQLEDLIVRLISVNYAKAGDLQSKVQPLLSERGNVSVDSRTNTLIVKDIKSGVEDAETLVKNLDTPTPQVLIEARIVEASNTFARDLGIEWGIDTAAISNNSQMDLFGNLTSSGLTTPSGQGGTKNFAVSLPASGSAGPLGAMGFTFGKLGGSSLTLDLRLSAGEVGGLSKIVSRPRIVTLDNKQAKISQGKTIPYQTVTDNTVQTQFFDATLDLTVTPHIAPDGSVMLKIKASKNSKGEDTAAGPVILKKEASTEILLKDGETTVIGGIVESTESDSASGVPLFKNIPVLGWLFKRQSVSNDQTELLIFITPTILK